MSLEVHDFLKDITLHLHYWNLAGSLIQSDVQQSAKRKPVTRDGRAERA